MSVDEHRQHAERLVVLDESHAAHIRRQIEHLLYPGDRFPAGVDTLQIQHAVVHASESLLPLIQRFHVYSANLVASGLQRGNKVAANESTGACDEYCVLVQPLPLGATSALNA